MCVTKCDNSAAKNERTAVFWDTSRESHDVRLHEDTSESLAGYTGRSSAKTAFCVHDPACFITVCAFVVLIVCHAPFSL